MRGGPVGKFLDLLKAKSPDSTQRRVEGEPVNIEIVGELAYQEHIRRVSRAADSGEFEIVLRPEPRNPHDRNAVAVLAEGQPVGYLPRAMAAVWQPALLKAAAKGYAVIGTAEVFGGTAKKRNLGVFGQAPWPGPGVPPPGAMR
jgi:hypothetical protein